MHSENEAQDNVINIQNPKRNMTLTYVLSLSVIACLSIIVHFMLDRIIAEQNDTAKVVNISGQQRMLSQRISLLTLEHLNTGAPEFKAEAAESLVIMEKNHQVLLKNHFESLQNNKSSPLSDRMQNLCHRAISGRRRKDIVCRVWCWRRDERRVRIKNVLG
jgi:nitrate/nitrite-specific signal transduction histidine kinase